MSDLAYASKYNTNVYSKEKWSHIIWESSKYPAENQTEQDHTLSATWADKNPYYRHEMITHERMIGYISDNFHESNPELEKLYGETTDYMIGLETPSRPLFHKYLGSSSLEMMKCRDKYGRNAIASCDHGKHG